MISASPRAWPRRRSRFAEALSPPRVGYARSGALPRTLRRQLPADQTLLPASRWCALADVQHFRRRNTKAQARKNIHAHYDLGNRFYGAWLDRTMTYSAGIFAPGDNDLAAAQTRKYRALPSRPASAPTTMSWKSAVAGAVSPNMRRGRSLCRVTGLTISQEQFDFAAEGGLPTPGLEDRVTFKLQDYRDETGTYDRIASIEMFEAVGEAFWPVYFEQLRDRLRPGARRAAGHHHPRREFQGVSARTRFHPGLYLPRRHAADRRRSCASSANVSACRCA